MDDYPTDQELSRIRMWPYEDLSGALDYVAELWSDYGRVRHNLTPEQYLVIGGEDNDRFLRLVTGGWSGNEDIIGAMAENVMLWTLTWRLSARGGLHIFRYP